MKSTASKVLEIWKIQCSGTVQGVGFRPMVRSLAQKLFIDGHISNVEDGVEIFVSCSSSTLDDFVKSLLDLKAPVQINMMTITATVEQIQKGFAIAPSSDIWSSKKNIPADIGVCNRCLREYSKAGNRRYGYTQISCNSCGPRFSSLLKLPFDRQVTSLNRFSPCIECQSEYFSVSNKRSHSQLISCVSCGPTALSSALGKLDSEICEDAARRLLKGEIGLVKGLSGVHLVCDASIEDSVERIRRVKGRPAKPFAVTVSTIRQARLIGHLNRAAMRLLGSVSRPIVVVKACSSNGLAPSVSSKLHTIGIALPNTALQAGILKNAEKLCGRDFQMLLTSANLSGEAIPRSIQDTALEVSSKVDFVIDHDRVIVNPSDDTVYLSQLDRCFSARLGRGITPLLIQNPETTRDSIGISIGPKASICSIVDNQAVMWPHCGSALMRSVESFEANLGVVSAFIGGLPKFIGTDLAAGKHHQNWFERLGASAELIQHHHAHAASVAYEHQTPPLERMLGLICDGYGFGPDGSGWGGEVLDFNLIDYVRKGSLRPIVYPPGVDFKPAFVAHTLLAECGHVPSLIQHLVPISSQELRLTELVRQGRLNGVLGNSTGRLFDGMSAILGFEGRMSYEGQAAMQLEEIALDARVSNNFKNIPCFEILEFEGRLVLDERPFFRKVISIVNELGRQQAALCFHQALAAGFVELVKRISGGVFRGVKIVLSGGSFQNAIFRIEVTSKLEASGFSVLCPKKLPFNDAGISLGFAAIAGAMHRK